MKRSIFSQLFFLLIFFTYPLVNFASSGLKDFSGKADELQDFTGKGKWTIVMFWAHDCHVCNKEAQQYVDFHERHKNKDAEVLGISLDGKVHKSDALAFLQRHKINFPNLIGEPENVTGLFEELTGADWFGTPTFLIYNPAGELRAQQVGAVPVTLIEAFMEKESVVTK